MKKWHFVALLIVGSMVLGASVFREPIARAAQSTAATIIGPLDSNGNVRVHEQGTAAVSVTNDTKVLLDETMQSTDSATLDVTQYRSVYVEAHVVGPGCGTSQSAPDYLAVRDNTDVFSFLRAFLLANPEGCSNNGVSQEIDIPGTDTLLIKPTNSPPGEIWQVVVYGRAN